MKDLAAAALGPKPVPVAESTPKPATEGDPLLRYGHLADVPLRVEAVLDTIQSNATQVASLRPGMVIPLSKPAGAFVDFYVDCTRLAAGEIAVIDDSLSLRIIELI